jgi:hypothetical protein
MSNPILGSGGNSAPPQLMHARRPHLEISPMNAHTTYAWTVHEDRLARLHAEAVHERFARSVPTGPRCLRRAIGRSLVRAGQRLAAEAAAQDRPVERLTPAGSR